MASGSCRSLEGLPREARAVLDQARRAVLATVAPAGPPTAVPVCFGLRAGEVVTAVDAKPKSGQKLARIKNIEANPAATLLVDRWDEDWTRVGWVMVKGTATMEPPGSADRALAARYPQYRREPPRGEVIAVRPRRIVWWTWE